MVVLGNYMRSLSLGSELYFRWLGGLADVARPFRRVVHPFWGAVLTRPSGYDPGGTPFWVCRRDSLELLFSASLFNRFRVVLGVLRPT